MTQKNDIYTIVTQKIIADLEKGELTWRKPWSDANLSSHVMRPLRWNDIAYSGINTIMLWSVAAERGYASPYWMTARQANDLKAHVREEEKENAATVVYVDKFVKEEKNPDGTRSEHKIPFLKMYNVYNAGQIEGLSDAFYKLPEPKIVNEEKRNEALEQFFKLTKANIFTGKQAAYSIARDRIEMPPFEAFIDTQNYYATLSHEVTHWTRHPSRLNRDFNRKKFGDEGYAREELVAELGACFLGADLGFEPVTREQHAAYIRSWLTVLKNDKRFIFQAAAFAQKAVEYLVGLQQQPQIETKPKIIRITPG